MAFNNVIPNSVVNAMLEEIRSEPKQLHFDEDVFFPCFYIKEEYLTECNRAFTYIEPNGSGPSGTISSHEDHPAFAALRTHLETTGYIEIPDYPCVNGDTVIKPFYLNDVFFGEGDRFLCAVATAGVLGLKRL